MHKNLDIKYSILSFEVRVASCLRQRQKASTSKSFVNMQKMADSSEQSMRLWLLRSHRLTVACGHPERTGCHLSWRPWIYGYCWPLQSPVWPQNPAESQDKGQIRIVPWPYFEYVYVPNRKWNHAHQQTLFIYELKIWMSIAKFRQTEVQIHTDSDQRRSDGVAWLSLTQIPSWPARPKISLSRIE